MMKTYETINRHPSDYFEVPGQIFMWKLTMKIKRKGMGEMFLPPTLHNNLILLDPAKDLPPII